MGSLGQIAEMIPGLNRKMGNMQMDDDALVKVEAVIQSMTIEERQKPHIINGSRRKRIALGSGTTIQDVNRLLKQFQMTQKMMKQMGRFGLKQFPGKFQMGF